MEILKESHTILLGHRISVYRDPKNITHENFTTEILFLWHLLLDSFSPAVIYIKGPRNDTEDTFRRLLLIKYDVTCGEITTGTLSVRYYVDILGGDTLTLTY